MTDEHAHGDSETDRLEDEWHERQPGLTQAEIDAQRVRPFRKAWDIDRFKRPGRVVNGMCEHGACDWCPHGCFDDAQRPMTDAERKRIIDKIHRDIAEIGKEYDAEA